MTIWRFLSKRSISNRGPKPVRIKLYPICSRGAIIWWAMQVSLGEMPKWSISNSSWGEIRCQKLSNLPFSPSPLFHSQLKEGKEFLLKNALLNNLRVSGPIKTSLFVAPHHNRRGNYRKCHYVGCSTSSSNQSFSSNRESSHNRGNKDQFRPHRRSLGCGNPSNQ